MVPLTSVGEDEWWWWWRPSHIQQRTKRENTNKLKREKEEEEVSPLVIGTTIDKSESSRKRKVSQAALSDIEVDGFAPSGVFISIYWKRKEKFWQ